MGCRALLFSLALAAANISAFAQSPAHMGAWKLDQSKSSATDDASRNTSVVYEADGDQTKITTHGTGPDGSPAHTIWTGKFDGMDYPVTGDPWANTRAIKVVDANTLAFTEKRAGEIIRTGRITLSADGKHRTTVLTMTGPDSKKATETLVYDKQ
jgi:formylglycine-generating enzyme required for sulfatase activity